ncbi:MAG TPA: cytochrome b/b6 domain-containing protein [Rhodanobacteraceae bacterium]
MTESSGGAATLQRHGLGARILHGINALAILVLLVTGFAVSGDLPDGVSALFGGHVSANDAHRWLGLALSIGLLLLALVCARRVVRLLGDVARFRWREWRWYVGFASLLARPARRSAPFHAGRFDPAQRVVFACIVAAALVLCATGVYLFWSPPLPVSLMGPMIRAHIVAAWVLIAALCLHVVAGSGVLPTHRHLLGAMFGNGRVPIALARRLWPGWAQRHDDAR